jgi:hypothetical protein
MADTQPLLVISCQEGFSHDVHDRKPRWHRSICRDDAALFLHLERDRVAVVQQDGAQRVILDSEQGEKSMMHLIANRDGIFRSEVVMPICFYTWSAIIEPRFSMTEDSELSWTLNREQSR